MLKPTRTARCISSRDYRRLHLVEASIQLGSQSLPQQPDCSGKSSSYSRPAEVKELGASKSLSWIEALFQRQVSFTERA